MVVKIQKSNPGMKGTLQYNQNKVAKGAASILRVWNMDEGSVSFRDFARTFKRYETANIRTGDISFQMSINPNPAKPAEALTDEEARNYAKTIMDELGYGDQPIILYEHHDIDRKHYHVVSIRTNEEGRKIRDSFEKERLQRAMAKYAWKYHYVIGNDEPGETQGKKRRGTPMGESVPRFDPKGADVRGQLTALFEEAMRYRFTTWSQFSAVMDSFGVSTAWYGRESDAHMYFVGQDGEGTDASPFITQDEMGEDFGAAMQKRMAQCAAKRELTQEEKKKRFGDRSRLAKAVRGALEYSRNEGHLVKMLQNKGIHLVLSRTEDTNEVFGATVVDRSSMQAWKLSEIDREIMPLIQEAARKDTGRWDREAQERKEEWIARKRAERLAEHIQANMDLAARQAGPREYVPGKTTARGGRGAHPVRNNVTDWLELAANILLGMKGNGGVRVRSRRRRRGF